MLWQAEEGTVAARVRAALKAKRTEQVQPVPCSLARHLRLQPRLHKRCAYCRALLPGSNKSGLPRNLAPTVPTHLLLCVRPPCARVELLVLRPQRPLVLGARQRLLALFLSQLAQPRLVRYVDLQPCNGILSLF